MTEGKPFDHISKMTCPDCKRRLSFPLKTSSSSRFQREAARQFRDTKTEGSRVLKRLAGTSERKEVEELLLGNKTK